MSGDPNKLTPTELLAAQQVLEAVKEGRDADARWFARRPEILTALAKMRKQAKECAS